MQHANAKRIPINQGTRIIPPRIPSLFNLLMRVGFAFLLLGGTATHAQEVLWQRDGDSTTSRFGSGVYPLGDQNDDGYADWAVFISQINGNATPWLTGIDFYYGGDPASQDPYQRIRGRGGDSPLYYRQVDFGDFNGDHYTDCMIVFNPNVGDSMYFYFYGGGPEADTIPERIMGISGFDFVPRSSDAGTIGDHDGDGIDDFYYYDPEPSDLVYIYLGNPDWNFEVALINQGEPVFSGSSRPRRGVFGDINGDGFDDYPTQEDGIVKFYFGSAIPDTVPDFDWNSSIGDPITMSIDHNGDGNDDVIKAIAGNDFAIFYGGNELSTIPTGVLDFPGCDETTLSWQASAGDFNGDGYEDMVGVQDGCSQDFGRLAVFAGGPYVRTTPILVLSGSPHSLLEGIWRAVGVGDINNDGIDDLAVGCQNGFNRRGRVVIFSGDTTLILPAEESRPYADNLSLSIYPNPFNSTTTLRLNLPIGTRNVKLTVTNVLGQTVEQREIEVLTPRVEIQLSLDNHPSGIYFAQIQSLNKTQTTKLVLLK